MVTKADVIYTIIQRALAQDLIEDFIMILVREKKNNNMKLNESAFNVGDYLQGKNVTNTFLCIYYNIMSRIERKILSQCKTVGKIVVIGGVIDSWSQKTIKALYYCNYPKRGKICLNRG